MLTMSDKEFDRLSVCDLLDKKLIKHKDAADRLQITTRQTKRLLKNYRNDGKKALISKKRGKPSNRRHTDAFEKQIRKLIETDYKGFGPTFAAEKLKEINGITISKESLRKYMIAWGIWRANRGKYCNIHQQRPRRECFGELVQIDGSPHTWFEDRGNKCCLIVFVDDATSNIVSMHFAPTESTQAYFECTKKYIKKYGRPWAFYSDRHGIFRVNKIGAEGKETQFGRAMRELGIKIICAHSPQAKGRVERANRTLQDRLVKDFRLKGISNIDAANKYAEEFMEKYNKKFGKKPMKEIDIHRKNIPSGVVLEAIFSERYLRKMSQNLEFRLEGSTYQVVNQGAHSLRDTQSIVCRFANGELKIWHKNGFVECREFKSNGKNVPIANGKDINDVVDKLVIENTERWKDVAFLRMIDKNQRNNSIAV